MCKRMRPLLLLVAMLPAWACDQGVREQDPGAAKPGLTEAPRKLDLAMDHDFGVVPHGARRSHEFELDLDLLGQPFVPLRVHLECSCGTADLRYRDGDGNERFPDGSAFGRNLPADGEKTFLRVELDTRKKEAVDLPKTASRGYVLLQQVQDPTGLGRVRWPFVIRFGVDAPVELRPFAALDFGAVAFSMTGELITTLRGDENHRDLRFLEARATDENLKVTLEPDGDRTVLRTTVVPNELGNHRAAIAVRTSDPEYVVGITATWKAVPDLEAAPMSKVTISTDLSRPQEERARLRQFVLVTDHDARRSPEFSVVEIVSDEGVDASSHFVCDLSPVPTGGRQQRLQVRYAGGLKAGFRGAIVLGKPDDAGAAGAPRLKIDLVVFDK